MSVINPTSEFFVANTLAKRNKLEPSKIDFSQGLGQKVLSKSCAVAKVCVLSTGLPLFLAQSGLKLFKSMLKS